MPQRIGEQFLQRQVQLEQYFRAEIVRVAKRLGLAGQTPQFLEFPVEYEVGVSQNGFIVTQSSGCFKSWCANRANRGRVNIFRVGRP